MTINPRRRKWDHQAEVQWNQGYEAKSLRLGSEGNYDEIRWMWNRRDFWWLHCSLGGVWVSSGCLVESGDAYHEKGESASFLVSLRGIFPKTHLASCPILYSYLLRRNELIEQRTTTTGPHFSIDNLWETLSTGCGISPVHCRVFSHPLSLWTPTDPH